MTDKNASGQNVPNKNAAEQKANDVPAAEKASVTSGPVKPSPEITTAPKA